MCGWSWQVHCTWPSQLDIPLLGEREMLASGTSLSEVLFAGCL